jgi:type IV secretory pathway VirJ component
MGESAIQSGNASYYAPTLAGFGEGGVLAEALLAQARPATVKGAAIVDPTVSLHTETPLCSNPPANVSPEGGFSYGPWQSLSGFLAVRLSANAENRERSYIQDLKAAGTTLEVDEAEREIRVPEAMAALLCPHLDSVSGEPIGVISSLPLVELPAAPHGPILAIIFSGDGGRRDIDKTIAQRLCSDGVSVIGWDSLHYFWSRKSPEQIANDVSLVIDTYASRWGISKVALIGYSFGAGILPFPYDRLTEEAKRRGSKYRCSGLLRRPILRSVSPVGEPASKDAAPTKPALALIHPKMIQCFYGENETDSACLELGGNGAEIIRIGSGHHFGGDYDALAQEILRGLRRRAG